MPFFTTIGDTEMEKLENSEKIDVQKDDRTGAESWMEWRLDESGKGLFAVASARHPLLDEIGTGRQLKVVTRVMTNAPLPYKTGSLFSFTTPESSARSSSLSAVIRAFDYLNEHGIQAYLDTLADQN